MATMRLGEMPTSAETIREMCCTFAGTSASFPSYTSKTIARLSVSSSSIENAAMQLGRTTVGSWDVTASSQSSG